MITLTPQQLKILNDLYYKQKMFFGRDKLYEFVKGYNITKGQLMNWLKKQNVYQLYAPRRRTRVVQNTILSKPFIQIGIDLGDMRTQSIKGYNYILSGVDLFSRMIYGIPIKNKEGHSVAIAFQKMLKIMTEIPKSVRSDRGSEFISDEFRAVLTQHNIKQVLSLAHKPWSNGAVERSNKTIKRLIKIYKTYSNDNDWVKILPKLIDNYNKTIILRLKKTPIQLETKGFLNTKLKMLLAVRKRRKKDMDDILVGNIVRIKLEIDDIFNYSRDTFIVVQIIQPTHIFIPRKYKLSDMNHNIIPKVFYRDDLLLVPDIQRPIRAPIKYEVQEIIKPVIFNNVNCFFIKWKGYSKESNTYEPKVSIVKDIPKLIRQFEIDNNINWKNKTWTNRNIPISRLP